MVKYKIEDYANWNVKASIKPVERKLLYDRIRRHKPKYVVETGSGASTICILLALEANGYGKLISIDRPNMDGTRARGGVNQVKQAWKNLQNQFNNWTVYEADITKKLPQVVAELPRIDFFLDDSCHQSNHVFFEFGVIANKMRSGSVFAMHDIKCEALSTFVTALNSNPDYKFLESKRVLGFWRKIV